jgi:hypothetical protein
MGGPRFASVSSVEADPRRAAQEAARALARELGGPPSWVLAFFSADLDAEGVTLGLSSELPGTELFGCSSFAEINSAGALAGSVTLLGARGAGLSAHAVMLAPEGRSGFALGQAVARALAPSSPTLILLLPDVLTVNATALLRGVLDVMGPGFPIVGGAPADSGAFERVHLFCGREIATAGVLAVAINGPLKLATAARSGYTPVSVPRTATRVEEGNVLLELDGRPALDVYREFLGPRADAMKAVSVEFPFSVISEHGAEAPALTRSVFHVDEARRALILGGDIPEGRRVRIVSASRRGVLAGARAATELARRALPDPDLALIFDCMSRKLVLGEQYKEECAEAFALLPPGLPKLGFYTFGEISPQEGRAEHHESTFTLALLKVEEPAR